MDIDLTIKMFEDYSIGKGRFIINPPPNADSVAEASISKYATIRREKMVSAYKELEALKVVRVIVLYILKWTPQQAADHMTKEIFEKTHLNEVAKYVNYPRDVDKRTDYAWLIKRAFPNDVNYDLKKQIRGLYDKVLSGELSKFPKKVFYEHEGILKLSILLNDYISQNIPSSSIEDLYQVFSNQAEANKMLKQANLYYAYKDFYDTPLEYLHESLGIYQDNFLYSHYQLKEALKQVEKHARNNQLL